MQHSNLQAIYINSMIEMRALIKNTSFFQLFLILFSIRTLIWHIKNMFLREYSLRLRVKITSCSAQKLDFALNFRFILVWISVVKPQ